MGDYFSCSLCPRNCMANRAEGKNGICQVSATVKVARAALHYWEEPCISGEKGSGAVFFSGCPLHCVFCQNEEISWGKVGKEISIEKLAQIMVGLQDSGANNINLVTGTQYIYSIVEAVKIAKQMGLSIPIIYNSSGYESVDNLLKLEGIIDVYLPDFKYMSSELAGKYSHAADYPAVAKAAIDEMVRQRPICKFNNDGFVTEGVIVRNLVLPGHTKDSKAVIEYLHGRYGNTIYLSLMSQFTPMQGLQKYPELNRRITKREYESVVSYALDLGVENAFIQDRMVAKESFIPDFNGEGV